MEPMYTTDTTGERSGMGFSFMEAFMDEVEVESKVGLRNVCDDEKQIGRGYMNKEQGRKRNGRVLWIKTIEQIQTGTQGDKTAREALGKGQSGTCMEHRPPLCGAGV